MQKNPAGQVPSGPHGDGSIACSVVLQFVETSRASRAAAAIQPTPSTTRRVVPMVHLSSAVTRRIGQDTGPAQSRQRTLDWRRGVPQPRGPMELMRAVVMRDLKLIVADVPVP